MLTVTGFSTRESAIAELLNNIERSVRSQLIRKKLNIGGFALFLSLDRKLITMSKKELSPAQSEELFRILKARFEQNMSRHVGIKWEDLKAKLGASTDKVWSLSEMERTGGEPDVAGYDSATGEYIFFDCSPESPEGRRNTCYDLEAQKSRKSFAPDKTAAGMASDIGIDLLTENQYHTLQSLGQFDLKTSSWLKTPADIRKPGGAIFGDRRFGRVFIYHNGASSYYGVRGFRGSLRV